MGSPKTFKREIRTRREDGSVTTLYLLHGEYAIVVFTLATTSSSLQIPIDLGLHSTVDIARSIPGMCTLTPDLKCWYRGSGVDAQKLLTRVREDSDPEIIWATMENLYRSEFD